MNDVRIKDVMIKEVLTIGEHMTSREVANFLVENQISGAPVVSEKGKLLGVVSLTDLARTETSSTNTVSGERSNPEFYERDWTDIRYFDEVPQVHYEREGMSVRDIMNDAIFTVTPETKISEAAQTMTRGRIHRLLVTDKDNNLLGIVTTLDLVKLLTG